MQKDTGAPKKARGESGSLPGRRARPRSRSRCTEFAVALLVALIGGCAPAPAEPLVDGGVDAAVDAAPARDFGMGGGCWLVQAWNDYTFTWITAGGGFRCGGDFALVEIPADEVALVGEHTPAHCRAEADGGVPDDCSVSVFEPNELSADDADFVCAVVERAPNARYGCGSY